jgi:plasmid stabilization system protein ParE
MKGYAVEVTASALDAIAEQARYIAVDAQAPLNAARWLEAIWDAAHSLERFPRRAPVAEEDAYVEYEVRQLVVGNHLLLFTVDDAQRNKVSVLSLRHGRRLADPGAMPESLEEAAGDAPPEPE